MKNTLFTFISLKEKVQKATFSAFKEHRKEKNIANYIKTEMDKVGGHGWNCVVGRNFGSHVIHQTNKYIFYSVKELYILLWRS